MEHILKLKEDLEKDTKELMDRHGKLTQSKQNLEHELKKIETELVRLSGATLALNELEKRIETQNEGKLDSSEENKD